MAASTIDINTPAQLLFRDQRLPLKANEAIPAGVMTAADANGLGVNASDVAGLVVIGRSSMAVSQANGDTDAVVERGVFGYAGSAALIALGQAMVGKRVYVVDNQTVGVASDTTNLVVAGRLEEIVGTTFFISMGLGDASISNVVGDNQTVGSELAVFTFQVPDAATGDIDIILKEKIEVFDVVCQKKNGAGAGNTMQIKNGATAISDAIACATDTAITRAGNITSAAGVNVIPAGGTLRLTATRAAGTRNALVTVYALRRA